MVSAILGIDVSSYYIHMYVLIYVNIGALLFLVRFHCGVTKATADRFLFESIPE